VVVNGPFAAERRRGADALLRTWTRHVRMAPIAIGAIAGLAAAGLLHERRPIRIEGAGKIAGLARVIDGDSLVVAGVEIRLYGIDAPEYRQLCLRGGQPWPCGLHALLALRAMTGSRRVECLPREIDRYDRTIAVCSAGGVELNAAMVAAGNAVAYGAYETEERAAREARRGIWSSSFEHPAVWRAKHPR
jgi:endonuclease YncB( thermonuclease family)